MKNITFKSIIFKGKLMINGKAISLIGSTLLIGGGSALIYELKRPKTIKASAEWKGIKLAKEEDETIWKALFFEKKDTLKARSIINEKALKDHCLKIYKKSPDSGGKLLSDVETFCSDSSISRKARIIANGFKEEDFLSSESDFKVAFTINRYTEGFRNLLSRFSGKTYTEETEAAEIWNDYKNYCDTKLNENEDNNLETIRKVCEKKGYRTAQEKAQKDGRTLLKKDQFKKQFAEIKGLKDNQSHTLLEDIYLKGVKVKDLNENDFKDTLNKWCEERKVKEISEQGFYPNIYSRFKVRCTEVIS